MTKKEMAERISRDYDRSMMYNLNDAYGRHSRAEDEAWDYCRTLCYQHGGHGLKVLSANTFHFTAAFLFTDKETGTEKVMRITKAHDTPYDYIEK